MACLLASWWVDVSLSLCVCVCLFVCLSEWLFSYLSGFFSSFVTLCLCHPPQSTENVSGTTEKKNNQLLYQELPSHVNVFLHSALFYSYSHCCVLCCSNNKMTDAKKLLFLSLTALYLSDSSFLSLPLCLTPTVISLSPSFSFQCQSLYPFLIFCLLFYLLSLFFFNHPSNNPFSGATSYCLLLPLFPSPH